MDLCEGASLGSNLAANKGRPSWTRETSGVAAEAVRVITVERLTKRFGHRSVLDDISFEVSPGEIFGFLGPNGAGKTTTIRILCGLSRPTAGRVEIFSQPIPAHLAVVAGRLGTIVEDPTFYGHLTAIQNLEVMSWTAGLRASPDRIRNVLEQAGLAQDASRRVVRFSSGMRQRLGLAHALLAKPELLIVDEPTTGLDPLGVRRFREIFQRLAQEGCAIFLSSHQLLEVERLCHRIALISSGRIVRYGPVQDLLGGREKTSIWVSDPLAALELLRLHGVLAEVDGSWLSVTGQRGDEVLGLLATAGILPSQVKSARATLEDLFVDAISEQTGR
ncbi:MAG: ABC transporter ATP-binding protein [Isosphaeraceae bacterium]